MTLFEAHLEYDRHVWMIGFESYFSFESKDEYVPWYLGIRFLCFTLWIQGVSK